mmetsp:Transcript_10041/g.22305  ORF Transcript_10041/g.22305 Transcript_10041/m.22305 type:complete len:340 (-) Transcript_10041:171-1190(-)
MPEAAPRAPHLHADGGGGFADLVVRVDEREHPVVPAHNVAGGEGRALPGLVVVQALRAADGGVFQGLVCRAGHEVRLCVCEALRRLRAEGQGYAELSCVLLLRQGGVGGAVARAAHRREGRVGADGAALFARAPGAAGVEVEAAAAHVVLQGEVVARSALEALVVGARLAQGVVLGAQEVLALEAGAVREAFAQARGEVAHARPGAVVRTESFGKAQLADAEVRVGALCAVDADVAGVAEARAGPPVAVAVLARGTEEVAVRKGAYHSRARLPRRDSFVEKLLVGCLEGSFVYSLALEVAGVSVDANEAPVEGLEVCAVRSRRAGIQDTITASWSRQYA